MSKLTVALPKGRLSEDTLELFHKAGISSFKIPDNTRELIFNDEQSGFTFLMVRAQDVGTYVERGTADIGVVGKDVLDENLYPVFQMVDLGFGYCRLVVAAPKGNENILNRTWLRVATKYVRQAENFFHGRGLNADIVKLYGSVEIAPLIDMADCIVDLVSTGATLKANGLVEVATIGESTARLVVSRPALNLYPARIRDITGKLKASLG